MIMKIDFQSYYQGDKRNSNISATKAFTCTVMWFKAIFHVNEGFSA